VVGTRVVRWNPAVIEAGGLSPICPVIALDAALDAVDWVAAGTIEPGHPLFHWAR
jgi:PTS system N-acetylglucosamine-specific IIA component